MNKEEAIHWLKIAVKQGDAKSQKQIPVWTAAWESEKKQRLDKSDRSKSGAEAKFQPGLWRVAGPWKIPPGDAREWFSKVDFVGVSGSLAKGSKSIFLGEEREVLEVDTLEVGNFANSLGMHADRIALVQGRWNVKKAGKALLALGSDDAIKVWVNGKLVASDWVGRKVAAYEHLYPIEIQEGENEIHAIVINFQGPWGFLLSVPDEATKALIYSKLNCPYCVKVESILNKAGIAVEKKILGEDIDIEEFKLILPNAKTVPQIYMYNNSEEVYIGGYIELMTELKNAKLID